MYSRGRCAIKEAPSRKDVRRPTAFFVAVAPRDSAMAGSTTTRHQGDRHVQADRESGAPARGHRPWRIVGKFNFACAVCALLLGSVEASAGTVVTDTLFNQITAAQANVPVTFGQVFKDGDVPQGATLTATLNGQPVTLQVDPKATNPDGSLRHAVLTVMVPSLAGGAKLPLTLATGATLPAGPAITLSQLLATGYNATASFNIGGKTYAVNARGLLQAAANAGTCVAWGTQCNVWLSGPLASEWVVNSPATASDGTTAPNLQVYFAVRAYSNGVPGTVGMVRTDIVVENSNAYAPQGQPQYTATLTSGSASYTSPALTQYSYTRWHHDLWWNNAQPQIYLQQDTQYIQDSMAVSRYMPLTPDESFLASLRQTCAPLDHCDQTQTMGNTGAQAAIGPLPRWTSVYIIDPDVRAYNWMLANTDALGAYSIHYRDQATGFPVSIQKHPDVTIADWSWASISGNPQEKADLLPPNKGLQNPNVWENAHQPAESYVPYMVTGSWYYMSELAFGASHNEIWPNEAYRGYSKGLIDAAQGQVRGKAWVLREMADAAWLLPDNYPLKTEFNADVENSLADWNAKYTNNPNANPLHVMNQGPVYDMHGGTNNGIAPWQHNFLTWSVGHAAELGFAGAAEFRDWLAKFEIGLMTDWQANPTQGYCWLEASAYSLQVKDASGNWLPSYTAAYDATFPTLAGLACNSPAMIAAMGTMQGQAWQAGEMYGYADSATGYPANLQIGLAAAANSGLPNAQAAWATFDSRSVKPSGSDAYNNYPNFALLPRSAPLLTANPPTEPNPVQVDPPSVQPSAPPPPVQPPSPPGPTQMPPNGTHLSPPVKPTPPVMETGAQVSPPNALKSPSPVANRPSILITPSQTFIQTRDTGPMLGREARLGLTLSSGVIQAERYFQIMLPRLFPTSAPAKADYRPATSTTGRATLPEPFAPSTSVERMQAVPIPTAAAMRPVLVPAIRPHGCEALGSVATLPIARPRRQIPECESISRR